MISDNLENQLANLPIVEPNPAREARLLATLRSATPAATEVVWWRRRIPLWQAAAACIAIIAVDVTWFRAPKTPSPNPQSPVLRLQIQEPLYARSANTKTAAKFENWRVMENR